MSFDNLKENDTILKPHDQVKETNFDENLQRTSTEKNESDQVKNLQSQKYPKFVFLIILNEFCERFSYYGIRTVMFIFLTSKTFLSF
jgi:hypothetical protein